MLKTEYLKFRNWLNKAKRNQNLSDIQSKSGNSIIHTCACVPLSYLGYTIYLFVYWLMCVHISYQLGFGCVDTKITLDLHVLNCCDEPRSFFGCCGFCIYCISLCLYVCWAYWQNSLFLFLINKGNCQRCQQILVSTFVKFHISFQVTLFMIHYNN